MFSNVLSLQAQIGLYGDVYISENAAMAVHADAFHFFDGLIHSGDNAPGEVIFNTNAHGLTPSHNTYIETPVLSIEHDAFVFPVGDGGVYHPLKIEDGSPDLLEVQYKREAHSNQTLGEGIDVLSNRFYWTVSGDKTAMLRLTWNNFSELNLLTDDLAGLLILGFTGTQWEIIPADIDPFTLGETAPTSLTEGVINSRERVDFSRYEALSLGAVALATDLLISEGITPNNDGINDTWIIQNIDRYPQAVIRVYNRWGGEVFFQNGNYQNNWNATYKNNTKVLPEGPYHYRIDTDNDGKTDRMGWIYINH